MNPTRRAWIAGAGGALGGLLRPLAAAPQHESFRADIATRDLNRSQLFLDDTWLEDTARISRVWQKADIFPEPVLRPETMWEGRQVALYGSAFRIGPEWRLYYMTYNPPQPSLLCMATSSDGLHWERPRLGLFEFGGNKANNIVWKPAEGVSQDGATVCHDPADPSRPFKMLYYARGSNRRGHFAAFSKDGISWDHRADPVIVGAGDHTNVMSGRDHTGKFVAFLRARNMMEVYRARSIFRSESADFLQWSPLQVVLRPDLLDEPNTELYGMAAFRYEDGYLGMVERWQDNPDLIDIQLAWSHDNRVWHRPAKRSSVIPPAYPWNRAWNSCASTPPIRDGQNLIFFVGGRSGAHQQAPPHSYGVVFIATVLEDRFAALQSDFKEGFVLTRPMTWPGGELVLNSTTTRYPEGHPGAEGGELEVTIRDENNQPIPGYQARHNGQFPRFGAKEIAPVRFPDGKTMNNLAGRRIRLYVTLRDARWFSFRARSA